MGTDSETVSGRITSTHHIPEWEAEWIEMETHSSTDSNGNTTSYTIPVTKHETHYPKWVAETTIGQISIEESYFDHISGKHGIYKERGYRPDYDSGDRYDYFTTVKDDPEFCDYPVNLTRMWNNPLKGTESLYTFKKISDEQAKKLHLHPYPRNDTFLSSRLIGVPLSSWNWDKMNSAIGKQKRVNVIMINFGSRSMDSAKEQQAYWQNGKKNDLVLCYGKGWSYVFGWTKSELVKQNLQTILLDNPINDDIIPLIKLEIRNNFKPYKWIQHENIQRSVPVWGVIVAFLLMIGSQVLCYKFFHENIFNKN